MKLSLIMLTLFIAMILSGIALFGHPRTTTDPNSVGHTSEHWLHIEFPITIKVRIWDPNDNLVRGITWEVQEHNARGTSGVGTTLKKGSRILIVPLAPNHHNYDDF